MREHIGLYRGKRIDDEWAIGNLLVFPDLACYICCPDADNGETLVKYSVDPNTVGEYVGADKNGKEIFEGDIVRLYGEDLPSWYYKDPIAVVKYNGFGFKPLCEYDCSCEGFVRPTDCEVIGNIHDNPELLEAADGK